jgi:nanoRNase/pAp phosphatase (c-di-AMP/oligoRNAs hydrolase)
LFSKELGGGGHQKASAFNLEKMPMNEAINKVLDTIKKIGFKEIE